MRTKKLRGRQLIIVKCRDCGATMAAVDEPQRNKAGYRAAMQGLAPNVVIKAPSRCQCQGGERPSLPQEAPVVTPPAPRVADEKAAQDIADRTAAKPGKAGAKAASARKKAAARERTAATSSKKKSPAKKTKKSKGRR